MFRLNILHKVSGEEIGKHRRQRYLGLAEFCTHQEYSCQAFCDHRRYTLYVGLLLNLLNDRETLFHQGTQWLAVLYHRLTVGSAVLLWLEIVILGQHDCQISQDLQDLCSFLALSHQQHNRKLIWRKRKLLEVLAYVVDNPLEYNLVLWLIHFRQNVHKLIKHLECGPHFDGLVGQLLIDDPYFYEMLELDVLL